MNPTDSAHIHDLLVRRHRDSIIACFVEEVIRVLGTSEPLVPELILVPTIQLVHTLRVQLGLNLLLVVVRDENLARVRHRRQVRVHSSLMILILLVLILVMTTINKLELAKLLLLE